MFEFFKNRTGGLYHFSPSAEIAFQKILEYDDWIIKEGIHDIDFKNDVYKISMWNSNKWYAWGNSGCLEKNGSPTRIQWKEGMPRKKTSMKVRKHIIDILHKKFDD